MGKGESAFKWHKRTKPGSQPHVKTTPTEPHPQSEQVNQPTTSTDSSEELQINEQGPTPESNISNPITPNELAKVRAQVAMVMSQPVSDGRCSSWFIEPVEWMESSLLGTVEGKVGVACWRV